MKILNITDIPLLQTFLKRNYEQHQQLQAYFAAPDCSIIEQQLEQLSPDYVVIQEDYEVCSGRKMIEWLQTIFQKQSAGPGLIWLMSSEQSQQSAEISLNSHVTLIRQKDFPAHCKYLAESMLFPQPVIHGSINKKISLLYVDDAPVLHNFIKQALADSDYQIIEAYDGDEGYQLYQQFLPQVVLTDLEMPRLNGDEMCKQIKQHNDGRYIPVIMLSTISDADRIDKAFACGIDDYLVKPVTAEKLQDKIAEYVESLEIKGSNKILVVDDDKIVVELVRHALVKNGFDVVTASDGLQAWEIFQTEQSEVVIADIEMPSMDGYSLCANINRLYPQTLLIMMSSFGKPSDITRGQAVGVKKHFTKPFDVEKLILYIEQTLRERHHVYKTEFEGLLSAIHSLIKALEKRDEYTAGHTERVAAMSTRVAQYMGLDKKFLAEIEMGANLHDIGKIGVRDNVLLKKEQLNEQEYKEIQRHTTFGAEILAPIETLHSIVPMILYHHERWDGKGYPKGLQGTAIPIGARIIAVADTYDAMTTNRPYRQGMPKSKALEVIEKNAGGQFCPECAKAFIAVMNKFTSL